MQIFSYYKQWPGTKLQKIKRFCHLIYLVALKRIFTKKKYIAEFELTDECNLRCKHCYFFNDNNTHYSINLPKQEWGKKFTELYKKGIRLICFFGGEPTLRMDIIMLAQQIFPFVDVITNGQIRIPNEYKIRIFLSIDGNNETHDSLRGPGVFQRAITNYNDDKRVLIGMCLTNDNYGMIEEVVQIALQNKFIGVGFNIYSSKLGVDDNMYIKPETRKKIIETLKIIQKKYPKYIILSDKAIKWYETPDHSESKCYWRSEVRHFNSALGEINACEHYDCSDCGNFCGANGADINFILSWEEKLRRIFKCKNKID